MRTWDRRHQLVRDPTRRASTTTAADCCSRRADRTTGAVTASWLFRSSSTTASGPWGLARSVSSVSPRPAPRPTMPAGCWPTGSIRRPTATRCTAARVAELHPPPSAKCSTNCSPVTATAGGEARGPVPRSMATYCKPLMTFAVADIDTAMVVKMIEPQWRACAGTMDRVRRRIGEVLGFAEVRGFRKPGPLPTDGKTISISCCRIRKS